MERLYTHKGWCILADKQQVEKATGLFKVNKFHPRAVWHNREPAEIAIQDGEHWVKENDVESMKTLAFTVGLTKIFDHDHKTQHEALKNKPSNFDQGKPISDENCQIFGNDGENVGTIKLARVAVLHHEAVASQLNFGVIMQPDRNGVSDMYAISSESVFFLPQFMYLSVVTPETRSKMCTQLVKDHASIGLDLAFRLGKVDLNHPSMPHDSAIIFRARLKMHLSEAIISRGAADGDGNPSERALEGLKEFLRRNSDPEGFKYPDSEALHMFLAKRPVDEKMAEQFIKEISVIWPDLKLSLDSNDVLDMSKQLCGCPAYDIPWPHLRCFLAVCSQMKTRRGIISVKEALEDTQQCCGNTAPPPASGDDAANSGVIPSIIVYLDSVRSLLAEISRLAQRPVALDETLPFLTGESTLQGILDRAASTPDVHGVIHMLYEAALFLMNRLLAVERLLATHLDELGSDLCEMQNKLKSVVRGVDGEDTMQ